MMNLNWRRFRHHWQTALAMMLYLALAAALVASTSDFAAAISARELNRDLEKASPAARTLLITGTRYTFGDALYEDLEESLGDVLKARLVIRHSSLPADPRPSSLGAGSVPDLTRLDVYALDPLRENVRVVRGRLPAEVRMADAVGNWPPAMEAVIGARAAGQTGYQVGDRVTASSLVHRLDIVGIVEPLDPEDDLWGGDLSPFAVSEPSGASSHETALPLIIAPASMQSYLGSPVFPHQVTWRITLDTQAIGPDTAQRLRSGLTHFQTQSATRGARTSTGLLQIFSEVLLRLSRLRILVWLLALQTLILVLYALVVLASTRLEQAQPEIVTLSARGLSAWQTTRAFALEVLGLALVAAPLGMILARTGLYLWSGYTGISLPARSSHQAWFLSGLTAGAGWLALVVPLALASWRSTRAIPPSRARPIEQLALHKRHVDLYLLAFGVLLVWQLNRSGSFLARAFGGSPLAHGPWVDPLLLLGPFLLLVAIALVFLRLVPFLSRLAARPSQRRRGLVLPLGLLRPARDPRQPSRLVLLVSLAVGLALFGWVLGHSLHQGQGGLGSDLLEQGAASLCQFNALGLVLFGALSFFLAQFAAVQSRSREVGVLRAMGLPARQRPAPYLVESMLVLLLALVAGAVLGLALSLTLVPYLSQMLLAVVGAGVTTEAVGLDWHAIARLLVALVAVYALALALLWLALAWRPVQRWPGVDGE